MMNKKIEKIKNQLAELSLVVNAFDSEAVKVKVIDRLLPLIMDSVDSYEFFNNVGGHPLIDVKSNHLAEPKKPGATRILDQLLPTDFFYQPRSIAEIVNYCNLEFDVQIKPTDISGVLLRLVKQNLLKRERSDEDNSFRYTKT